MSERDTQPSYKRHRFPPAIIANAVWLYFRFALRYRDVAELLAERGVSPCAGREVDPFAELVLLDDEGARFVLGGD